MIAAARRRLGQFELTAILAASMSMTALGIDLLLPAFGDVRASLALAPDSTAVSGLITAYFLGLALGQPIYGPASDSFGRKPLLWAGFAVYGIGALATAVSPTLPLLLASRFLWGLGAAGPRVITVAIIRDRYEGEQMSRAMSLVMSVFMVVPVFAPTIGALGVAVVSWRWLFVACAVVVALLALWSTRMAETLPADARQEPDARRLLAAGRVVVGNRVTVGHTLAMTALYGGFTSYLASSELIFGEVFDAGAAFPLLFGGLAIVMAIAMIGNARFVERIGSRRLVRVMLGVYLVGSTVLLLVSVVTGGRPPLWLFLATMAVVLTGHGVLVPNLGALAMQPMGAVAGMASSLTGAVQIAAGALIGLLIDQRFDGTILPFSVALLVCGVVAGALATWAERTPRAITTVRRPVGVGNEAGG